MKPVTYLVVTSISPPNRVLRSLARGSIKEGIRFILIGDTKSPAGFKLRGCDFWSLERQKTMTFSLATQLPEKHYSRKNLGYLEAIKGGADIIVETDDDNVPGDGFWKKRGRESSGFRVNGAGWVNVYRYFSNRNIWPRGFPLDEIQNDLQALCKKKEKFNAPIQQGLADDNPDVDALFRLLLPLPVKFRKNRKVVLGPGNWCPFNSQNTTWFREAFPLLYLPSYCSFRMTDIWRSFIAQRVAWQNNWSILFHSPTVHQERNQHNLMIDFRDEVPGYLENKRIVQILDKIKWPASQVPVETSLWVAYEALMANGIFPEKELDLLRLWLNDLQDLNEIGR